MRALYELVDPGGGFERSIDLESELGHELHADALGQQPAQIALVLLQMRDRLREHAVGIDDILIKLALRADMGIGNLGDQHASQYSEALPHAEINLPIA